MKILLTGATGYIGKRLLPVLLAEGHQVICCVRDRNRFDTTHYDHSLIRVIEVNFLDIASLDAIPEDIDAAYYLIHSMSASIDDFNQLEGASAHNFKNRLDRTSVRQVVYLSGIINEEKLSKHLTSRKEVERILSTGKYHLTTLRAGIIVGSGSASFEIIRDLVEKLPLMIAPKWLNTKTQPIAVRNVIQYLKGVLMNENTYGNSYDIGGPEILTYKKMLLTFASIRNLPRKIIVVPVMSPKVSSYWLYFITSTSYKLAVNLVSSMKVEVICKENDLNEMLNIPLLTYEEAVKLAFDKIEQQEIISHWTDALSTKKLEKGIPGLMEVPSHGCVKDARIKDITQEGPVLDKIWSIGGKNGWYYATWLWKLRGFIDKIFGGVGLRRGRKRSNRLNAGDSLDFWRVLYASRKEKRMLLYAEMKLPGEAWLEFRISQNRLSQTVTFRPLGLWGRTYWWLLLPIHIIIFEGMIRRIARPN
jgi:uncharacterized protein YbjT (DUF2867 family)